MPGELSRIDKSDCLNGLVGWAGKSWPGSQAQCERHQRDNWYTHEGHLPGSKDPARGWIEMHEDAARPQISTTWLMVNGGLRQGVRNHKVAHCQSAPGMTQRLRKLLFYWKCGGTEINSFEQNWRFSAWPSSQGWNGANTTSGFRATPFIRAVHWDWMAKPLNALFLLARESEISSIARSFVN